MTRIEASNIMQDIRNNVNDCINNTPLRRKGDTMYVKGLNDLADLVQQILNDYVDK